jgi:gas vesicle protein
MCQTPADSFWHNNLCGYRATHYSITIKNIVMSSKLIAGIAIGVLVGILFAPDKGSVTRQKIADTGGDLKDKFNDFIDSLSGKAEEAVDDAKDFASKAKSQFQ